MKHLLLILFSFTFIHISHGQSFDIDPGHTFISFSVNRFATVDVKGRFNDFSGNVQFDEETGMISAASLTIDVKSIDTGHDVRDGHLMGATWLDADNYPKIQFDAKSFKKVDGGFEATGELTIHGTTNEVSIPFEMTGPAVDPTKTTAIGISGTLVLDRQDYGISFSRLMDNGKLFIGNEVRIGIDALAIAK